MLRRAVRLPNLTLLVLAVLAVGLSFVAIRQGAPASATTSLGPGVGAVDGVDDPSSTPSDTASGESSTAAASSSEAPTATPVPVTQSIVAVDDRTAWRLTTGSCTGGGAALAVTTDAGRTWRSVDSPVPRLVRVQPTSASSAFVVGADDTGCDLVLHTTGDGGATWSPAASIAQAWARDLASPSTVHVPGGGARQPCGDAAVLDLARADTTHASVACADGSVRTSDDSGRSWELAAQLPGAVAVLAAPGRTYAVLPSATSTCHGLTVVATTHRATPACVALDSAPEVGTVSGSVTSAAAWLRVGERTFRSTDGLATWHEAGA